MSTLFAYYSGVGCSSLQKLKAINKNEAEKEIQEEFSSLSKYKVDFIQLLEVKEVMNINVASIKKSLSVARRLSEIKRIEAEERAHYGKKYGTKN